MTSKTNQQTKPIHNGDNSATNSLNLDIESIKYNLKQYANDNSNQLTNSSDDEILQLLLKKLAEKQNDHNSDDNEDQNKFDTYATSNNQIDLSELNSISEFNQFAINNNQDFNTTAIQFIKQKANEAYPELVSKIETLTINATNILANVSNQSSLDDARESINEQITATTQVCMYTCAPTVGAPASGSTTTLGATNTASTSSATTTSMTNSQKYASLLNSSSNISIIYLSIFLFLSLSDILSNILMLDNQIASANSDATDAVTKGASAFQSIADSAVMNFPEYVVYNTGETDENGDPKTETVEFTDMYQMMQFAYDPAHANYTVDTSATTADLPTGYDTNIPLSTSNIYSIGGLQADFDGLYTQLSAYDETDFEDSMSSYSKDNAEEFYNVFNGYVSQLNSNISTIDATGLDTINLTAFNTGTVNITTTDKNGTTTTTSYTGYQPNASQLSTVVSTLKEASSSGASISTSLQTQMQADSSQYLQTIEGAQSFAGNIATINQRLWN